MASCHIEYALTVWIQVCPNIPKSVNMTFESVAFGVIIFSVYPCGVVEATCAHYAPSWYKHRLFAHLNNSVYFANPTRGRLLSHCVTICQHTSPGLMKERKVGLPHNLCSLLCGLIKLLSLKGYFINFTINFTDFEIYFNHNEEYYCENIFWGYLGGRTGQWKTSSSCIRGDVGIKVFQLGALSFRPLPLSGIKPVYFSNFDFFKRQIWPWQMCVCVLCDVYSILLCILMRGLCYSVNNVTCLLDPWCIHS